MEHFLGALNFQAAGRGPVGDSQATARKAMSENIWSSLRLCLSLMGKSEHYKLLDDRNLDELNRMFGK